MVMVLRSGVKGSSQDMEFALSDEEVCVFFNRVSRKLSIKESQEPGGGLWVRKCKEGRKEK